MYNTPTPGLDSNITEPMFSNITEPKINLNKEQEIQTEESSARYII